MTPSLFLGSRPRSWARDRTFTGCRLTARLQIFLPPRRFLVSVPVQGYPGLFLQFLPAAERCQREGGGEKRDLRSLARALQGRLRAPCPDSQSSPLNAGVIRQASRHHEPIPLARPGLPVFWPHSLAAILARAVSDRIAQNRGQEGSETLPPV
ncbi:hypothetical protein NDU88_006404 [Pleurodeles waltl]|uniref:Uncharacterized protein n=1 Tax=Pleurodeles waltl TaxID=8319 RepID=A0AAV7UMV6_PLEWA|nr:hypothetical protein NDU88_006404 [Pleurodeles waltl]